MNFFQKIVVLLFCLGLVVEIVEPLWAVGQDIVTEEDGTPYYNVEAHMDYMYDEVPAPASAKQVKKTSINDIEGLDIDAPMDLKDPSNVETKIEYDTETGNYVVRTMMGETEISTPFSLSPDEYKQYSLKKQMGQYWA